MNLIGAGISSFFCYTDYHTTRFDNKNHRREKEGKGGEQVRWCSVYVQKERQVQVCKT